MQNNGSTEINTSRSNLSFASNVSSEIEMKSFSEYNTDDTSINDSSEEKCTNPIDELVQNVLYHRAKQNLSYDAASNVAQLLNSMPGSLLSVPEHRTRLRREAKRMQAYEYKHYVFCQSCDILIQLGEKCNLCNRITKKSKDNYFIYIPIKPQIKAMLDNHLAKILNHFNETRSEDDICDVIDSKIFKEAKMKNPGNVILPLTLNIDGAKIFTSSKSSLWPIQLLQNYLPPNMRFQSKNVLLAGLYCGKNKPNVSTIMAPLAIEMNEPKQCISIWYDMEIMHFLPMIIYCACDIPARGEVQNCKISGYYSCPNCEQKGELIRNSKKGTSYVRFVKEQEKSSKRTHENTLAVSMAIASESIEYSENNVKGEKGLSCMVAFKNFNLIDSYIIDWMHGSLLGVMKLLLDFWLGTRPIVFESNESIKYNMLNPQQRLMLNRRIIALKPPMRISHKPRSILERSFYTANEYRSLLWYYLRYALKGLLNENLLKHFELLSSATYMLSKTRVTKNDIQQAGLMLNQFSDEFETFYGRNSITLNVHLLRHYTDNVESCGPLWCHSLFTFENNIGVLKNSFCSTVDVVEQIASNYCIKSSVENSMPADSPATSIPQILRPKQRAVPPNLLIMLRAAGCYSTLASEKYIIGFEMKWKSQILKSISSIATKSVDFFIELYDGSIGIIEFFVICDEINYVVVRKYEVTAYIHHWHHVKRHHLNEYVVVKPNQIREKLIYLRFDYSKVAYIEVVTKEPNPYEGN